MRKWNLLAAAILAPAVMAAQENKVALAAGSKAIEYNPMIFGQFIEHFHRQI
jgi:hypothetical protein